jgi:hypothetical protein
MERLGECSSRLDYFQQLLDYCEHMLADPEAVRSALRLEGGRFEEFLFLIRELTYQLRPLLRALAVEDEDADQIASLSHMVGILEMWLYVKAMDPDYLTQLRGIVKRSKIAHDRSAERVREVERLINEHGFSKSRAVDAAALQFAVDTRTIYRDLQKI